jgi:hypothetical protein
MFRKGVYRSKLPALLVDVLSLVKSPWRDLSLGGSVWWSAGTLLGNMKVPLEGGNIRSLMPPKPNLPRTGLGGGRGKL